MGLVSDKIDPSIPKHHNAIFASFILAVFVVLVSTVIGDIMEPCNILIFADVTRNPYDRTRFTDLKVILESMGNTVTLGDRTTIPNLTALLPGVFSQFWYIDGQAYTTSINLSAAERAAIIAFAEAGKGLAVETVDR